MALPALRLLDQSRHALVLVGRPWAGDLFAGMDWAFEPITDHILRDAKRLRVLMGTRTRLVRGLLFPNSASSALLFRLAGIRAAGLATDGRRLLLSTALREPPPMHEVERFWYVAANALRVWDERSIARTPPRVLGLVLTIAQRAVAQQLLTEHGVAERYALLAPIAAGLHRGQNKQWPYFAELLSPLRSRGLMPIAVPTAQEAEATRRALPAVQFLPPVALGCLAAIAARSSVVIANDSGVSHVAAAVGAPQVTIFGATDANRTGPWSPRAVRVGENGRWPAVSNVIKAIDTACATE
ncbi:MAG: glycosyltransferase family 9 protein [Burkholderiaceae bacterium]